VLTPLSLHGIGRVTGFFWRHSLETVAPAAQVSWAGTNTATTVWGLHSGQCQQSDMLTCCRDGRIVTKSWPGMSLHCNSTVHAARCKWVPAKCERTVGLPIVAIRLTGCGSTGPLILTAALWS